MNYRQTEGTATTWRRSSQVQILNPWGGIPSIRFSEEDVANVNGQDIKMPLMFSVNAEFHSAAEIPLINPETGESLGKSATHEDLYVLLHSLYIQLAARRDEAALAGVLP